MSEKRLKIVGGLNFAEPANYPNRLYDIINIRPREDARRGEDNDVSSGRRATRSYAAIGFLLLICLIPRLWVAMNKDTICPDAVQYLDIASALGEGDYAEGFQYLNLNIYPAILLVLMQTGRHWMAACEVWSLAMATLAVLPLYGLMRRIFDAKAAILACLLYALHPRLIIYSPLILRDPTFWFLFLLSLYLQWRAATESRWWLFVASGAALFLTIHTRTEGWLAIVPLVFWTALRFWFVALNRRRLVLGFAAALAVIPLSTILINVTLLRDLPNWQMASMRNFHYALDWLHKSSTPSDDQAVQPSPTDAGAAPAEAPATPAASVSGLKILQRVIVRFTKTFTYVYGGVILAGFWALRRNFLRGDTLPFFFIFAATLTGVWIRYNILPIDERYFFPIVLVSLPGLCLGLLQVADWIAWIAERCAARGDLARPAAIAGLLGALILSGIIDATHTGRIMFGAWHEQAELGRWILQERGPEQTVAGNNEEMRLVGYYADGINVPLYIKVTSEIAAREPEKLAQVAVFWEDSRRHESDAYKTLRDSLGNLLYREVPVENLPPDCQDLVVLERMDAAARNVASVPSSTKR
jgi:hypothetical protein